jgi:hypothetical protein
MKNLNVIDVKIKKQNYATIAGVGINLKRKNREGVGYEKNKTCCIRNA